MTQPAPPPLDAGNQLLAETPAQLACALVDTPTGQRMALTIRTNSTTLTVLLAKKDADAWAGNVKRGADSMSGTGLIVAGSVIPNGHGG